MSNPAALFIIGLDRSGTTAVARVCKSHPDVAFIGNQFLEANLLNRPRTLEKAAELRRKIDRARSEGKMLVAKQPWADEDPCWFIEHFSDVALAICRRPSMQSQLDAWARRDLPGRANNVRVAKKDRAHREGVWHRHMQCQERLFAHFGAQARLFPLVQTRQDPAALARSLSELSGLREDGFDLTSITPYPKDHDDVVKGRLATA